MRLPGPAYAKHMSWTPAIHSEYFLHRAQEGEDFGVVSLFLAGTAQATNEACGCFLFLDNGSYPNWVGGFEAG